MTGRPPTALMMSERDLDEHVRTIAAQIGALAPLGLLAYHTRDSRRSAAGFPDWVFAGPGGVMFRENKTAIGKLSRDQMLWFTVLRRAQANVGVWRPADLQSGLIHAELCHLAGLSPAPPLPGLSGQLSPAAEQLIDRIMGDE